MHVCFAARKSRCGEGSFAGLSDFKLQEMHSGYKREHARVSGQSLSLGTTL